MFTTLDLFSGAGGMSYGFQAHPAFTIAGAVDAQIGKPSAGRGTLGCNASYFTNIGVQPTEADLATADALQLCERMGLTDGVTVLCACPPCTGFSRTMAQNHLRDDDRNSLVGRITDFVKVLSPEIVLIENARELVMGRFSRHLRGLLDDLAALGYKASATTHFLSEFGLPQKRERAMVTAVKRSLPLLGLKDLWSGYQVNQKAIYVRRAVWDLPAVKAGEAHPQDHMHVSPKFGSQVNRDRLEATPHDGGGWVDLVGHPDADRLLAPSMKRRIEMKDFGSHPDVYGRLWWDRPAATIKRECGHIGNGRYAHPEQDRQCTVRELAILQGFPRTYAFVGTITNMYRHIGDAVPPLISYQLAALTQYILTGARPEPGEMVLPGTHLTAEDIEEVR